MPVPGTDLSTKIKQIQKGTGVNKLVELYCDVDDFLQNIYPQAARVIVVCCGTAQHGAARRKRN